jgi:hypothetical protein
MPANSGCRFQPETLTVGTSLQSEAILFYTNVQSTLASNETRSTSRGIAFAFGLPAGLALLLLRRRSKPGFLAIFLLGLALSTGLSGCGSGTNASNADKGLVTPAGTYTVTVVFTGSNGLTTTHSVPVTFTVIQDSGPF